MHTRSFSLPGLRLQGLVAGPAGGRPVMLLHGFPESADAWDGLGDQLAADGLHVVAPHQRGYAGSDKPSGRSAYTLDRLAQDVLDLADLLGWGRFALVGHDWGGVVAWHLASNAPQRLDRLVILNAPHAATLRPYARRHPSQVLRSAYAIGFQLPWLPETLLGADDGALLLHTITGSARHGAFPSDLLARYRAQWAAPGALTAMVNWYRALAVGPRTPATPITVPTTVLWGDRDRFLGPGLADAALALCPQGRLVRLPEATHWLHHEQPAQVLTQVRAALD